MGKKVLVHGLAIAGASAARALIARGHDVVVSDDSASEAARRRAADLGLDLVAEPDEATLRDLVRSCSIVSPAPGIPEGHPLIRIAQESGVPLRSELDLAYEWEQDRPTGPRPMLTVTGTDGKTTTTLLAVHVLEALGLRSVAAGNTEVPLVDAIDLEVDVLVVEATSFRLAWTPTFRSETGAWLNLAPDHQDWHSSMDTYEAAKSRVWANMRETDVAIGNVADETVMRNLASAVGRRVTFGATNADYRLDGDVLTGPGGALCHVGDLRRALPHDITNGLCAAALVLEAGLGNPEAVGRALTTFVGPSHRIELVATSRGVSWYDDSKATTPHAAATAIAGFDSVVLIAGGRNKDLDLSAMAVHPSRMRAVVTIGQDAAAVAAAFEGICPIIAAGDMAGAVPAAAELARPGDVVLLSPGCTSYDAYSGYAARGDDFAARARAIADGRLHDTNDTHDTNEESR